MIIKLLEFLLKFNPFCRHKKAKKEPINNNDSIAISNAFSFAAEPFNYSIKPPTVLFLKKTISFSYPSCAIKQEEKIQKELLAFFTFSCIALNKRTDKLPILDGDSLYRIAEMLLPAYRLRPKLRF